MSEAGGLLLRHALDVVPRVLGLADRNGASPTLGCCDRAYWHYLQTDFGNGRMQEAGWLFALAAATPDRSNRFFESRRLAEWARDAWKFWFDRRNGDGSVCEVYPHERSFCATAFSARAFVETVRLLGGAPRWGDELQRAEKTMRWIGSNANPETANQMAASLHALAGYAALTGEAEFEGLAAQRKAAVLALVDASGVFAEYGGLDSGYQTVTLSCLAGAARAAGGDRELEAALVKGEARVATHVDDLGRHDAAANSRFTQFVYPYGLAVLESAVLERVCAGLAADAVLRPAWMDDRYCIGLATDYLCAARELLDVDDDGKADRSADA